MAGTDFASDNHAGTHPEVLAALAAVNGGHVHSYGADPHTERATALLRDLLGAAEVYFVFNGTAANVLSAAAACRPHQAVICADTAHFHHDECGATERFAGCRVLAVPPDGQGKLTPASLQAIPAGHAEPHQNVPRLVSITQATELGTVYTPAQVRAVAAAVHQRGWVLHMDGARLANAAAGLEVPLREVTGDAGVDVLSFGATKNGAMMAEAVVFFDRALAAEFPYLRKQGLQLASKMRFVSAQFEALLT
ncbi:MAG: aminotransferase class V-fold PLP-dependent enzyme, partial [Gemmatimonadota bacterium]